MLSCTNILLFHTVRDLLWKFIKNDYADFCGIVPFQSLFSHQISFYKLRNGCTFCFYVVENHSI